MSLPAFLFLVRTAENRTLRRARALSKREAFVASGRGRRQAAEAGAYLRSKYADSPRKLPTQNGCDVYRISAGHAPHQRNPKPAENRTLCRARALRKRYGNAGWDALSQWRPRRKPHPGILIRNGMHFPDGLLAESSSRNPASNWDALSAPSSQLQNLCALHSKTG